MEGVALNLSIWLSHGNIFGLLVCDESVHMP